MDLTSQKSQTPSYNGEMTSYYWPNKMSATMTSGFGGAASSQYIIPHVRLNRDHREKKKLSLYLNDSTHLNPSDPNTMIDQGQVRNSPYNMDIEGH